MNFAFLLACIVESRMQSLGKEEESDWDLNLCPTGEPQPPYVKTSGLWKWGGLHLHMGI